MSDITPIIRPSGAARTVNEAVNAAWERGLFVSTARDLGVVCTSTAAPRWEVDPRGGRAVSALGAVLLAKQPPIADVDAALSHVFDNARPEFHEGIEDAVAGERDVSRDDRLYVEGCLIGSQMRELIRRHYGVPAERTGNEVTEKLPEPRS